MEKGKDRIMDDLISRADAIKAVEKYYADHKYITRSRTTLSAICEDMKGTINALPSAQRTGKWSRHTLGSTGGYGTTIMHQCSECECMTISRFRYCPNCGARMDAE